MGREQHDAHCWLPGWGRWWKVERIEGGIMHLRALDLRGGMLHRAEIHLASTNFDGYCAVMVEAMR